MKHSKKRDQPYISGWDNNLYFAWARSLALDGDVDFDNDFSFLANWKGGSATQEDYAHFVKHGKRTRIKRLPNVTGIGFGLASVPLLLAARGMSSIYTALTGIQVSPFAAIYCVAFIFTSIFISFAGLAISFRILRNRFGEQTAFRAMIAGTFGLSTLYYIWFENTMSQAVVFGFSTFFLAMMLRWQEALESPHPKPQSIFLLSFATGILLGIFTMTHFPSMAWGAAPVVLGAYFAWDQFNLTKNNSHHNKDELSQKKIPGHWPWIRLLAGSMTFMALGTFLGFLPQLIAWKSVYGSWYVNSYEVTVHFRLIDVWNVFFDKWIGLFLWTPFAVIALGGLFYAAWHKDRLCVAACTVFLVFLWEFSSCNLFRDGNQGHAFGMRYYVDGAFLFYLGLAVFFHWFATLNPKSLLRKITKAAVIILIIWNLFFMTAYRADIQPQGQPIAFKQLFLHWKTWIHQAETDINLFKRIHKKRFTLFTPVD